MRAVVGKWWAVVAATIAIVFGNGPVVQFTFGIFIDPISKEFNATRAQVSLAVTVAVTVTGICLPIVGWLIDRHGARKVTLSCIVLLAAALLLSASSQDLTFLIVAFALMGMAAAGQSPVSYSRVIAHRFNENRGLALGIAMTGGGIGTILLPKITAAIVHGSTWQNGYRGLAVLLAVIALPAAFFALGMEKVPESSAHAPRSGNSFKEAIRQRTFWFMLTAFFMCSACAGGVITHIVPMLTDAGIPHEKAVMAIMAIGASMIVGRLTSGYLIDRHSPAAVAASYFGLQILGIVILLVGFTAGTASLPVAALACFLVGLGLGAEVDIAGFMLSRIFGLRAFGTLYGAMFSSMMIASGVGPLVLGWAHSQFEDYTWGLILLIVGLIIAIAAILPLRYPQLWGDRQVSAAFPAKLAGTKTSSNS